ncbi:MAG: SCP2 sterol-binding domain-containing protein [Actinomycetota bacterium]
MAVKFLSEAWAAELQERLNGDPAFGKAVAGQTVAIQQAIATGDGPVDYWLKVADGVVSLGVGSIDDADATIEQDYATAVGLARREVSPVAAFMTGKIKVEGNLGTLMALQSALGLLADHMSAMDIEY